jgi:hypothetical protein
LLLTCGFTAADSCIQLMVNGDEFNNSSLAGCQPRRRNGFDHAPV